MAVFFYSPHFSLVVMMINLVCISCVPCDILLNHACRGTFFSLCKTKISKYVPIGSHVF